MTKSTHSKDEQLQHLFAELESSESRRSNTASISFGTIQAQAARRGKSRQRLRATCLAACIGLLAFGGWWSVQETQPPKPSLAGNGNEQAVPKSPDSLSSQDQPFQAEPTLTVSESPSSPTPTIAERTTSPTSDPIQELLDGLNRLESERNRITAELRNDSLEQRIAHSESELLQQIRLRSRSDYLLSLN